MKTVFILFSAIYCQELQSKCLSTYASQALAKVKACKTKAINEVNAEKTRAAMNWRKKYTDIETQLKLKKMQLCKKTETYYEPLGFIRDIPVEWGCPKNKQVQEIYDKLTRQHQLTDKDAEYNIVLVGMTGSGKSYFGNALLGALRPGQANNVPFPSAPTTKSYTANVHGQTGYLFGGHYDNVLGIKESIKINVFDTPGFADADINKIRQNKLLISNSLLNNIHLVIFLTSTDRFDASNQIALKQLNEWTSGEFWDNLLIVKGRTTFDERTVSNRIENNENRFQMTNIDEVSSMLIKRSQEVEPWIKKTVLPDGTVRTRPLTQEDFRKPEISLINMAQHNECISSDGKTPTQNCWKLPKVSNESGVYTYDYDYGDYDDDNSEYNYDESNYDYEKVIKYEDKYVFVEEAKRFLSTLKSKKAHPIIPRSRLVKIELDNDNKSLKSISDKFAEIDNEEAENTEDQNSLLLKLLECEEDLKDDNDRCYMWMSWGEWTKTIEVHTENSTYKCSGCGVAERIRTRDGCKKGRLVARIDDCVNDFGTQPVERELCTDLPKCDNKEAELRALIVQQNNYYEQQKQMYKLNQKRIQEQREALRKEIQKQRRERNPCPGGLKVLTTKELCRCYYEEECHTFKNAETARKYPRYATRRELHIYQHDWFGKIKGPAAYKNGIVTSSNNQIYKRYNFKVPQCMDYNYHIMCQTVQ